MKKVILLLSFLSLIFAQTTTKIGDSYFHSNGTSSTKIGNSIFNSNELSLKKYAKKNS